MASFRSLCAGIAVSVHFSSCELRFRVQGVGLGTGSLVLGAGRFCGAGLGLKFAASGASQILGRP